MRHPTNVGWGVNPSHETRSGPRSDFFLRNNRMLYSNSVFLKINLIQNCYKSVGWFSPLRHAILWPPDQESHGRGAPSVGRARRAAGPHHMLVLQRSRSRSSKIHARTSVVGPCTPASTPVYSSSGIHVVCTVYAQSTCIFVFFLKFVNNLWTIWWYLWTIWYIFLWYIFLWYLKSIEIICKFFWKIWHIFVLFSNYTAMSNKLQWISHCEYSNKLV